MSNTICPLPWIHASFDIRGRSRICCNTDSRNLILDDNGNYITINDVDNYNDVLNTKYVKDIRQSMINGERHPVCSNCYKIEDNGGISPRMSYIENYQYVHGKIEVQYIDMALSNKCNIKCMMCSPLVSDQLYQDFDQLNIPFDKNEYKLNMDTWQEDDVLRLISTHAMTLKRILTTGGEPLINHIHLKVLDWLIDNGHADHIVLSYHTNATVLPLRIVDKWTQFKQVNLNVSLEGTREINDYVRYGSRWDVIEKNIKRISKLTNQYPGKINCHIHTCLMASNIFNFVDLCKWLNENTTIAPIPYSNTVYEPKFLNPSIMPHDLKNRLSDVINDILGVNFNHSMHQKWIKDKLKNFISLAQHYQTQPYDDELWKQFIDYHKKFESKRQNNLSHIQPLFERYWKLK